MSKRTIRIFLSTPCDVAEERRALAGLVAEINDVITFLAPERDVSIKLIHYETDAYPDIGSGVQGAVNHQIPVDYDIHFGVMWKRCGTPTSTADSGTVEEFDRALSHREKTGKPTIMFYFGTEEISMPSTDEEIDQLKNVIKFRRRIEAIGLTATYPTRAEFRERARIGLLRAVADVLRNDLPAREESAGAAGSTIVSDSLLELATQYNALRADLPPGPNRTTKMTALVEEMKAEAPGAQGALAALMPSNDAGCRLAAIAILQVFPNRAHLAWLADRLDPEIEKPFVGYHAAIALLQAARSLPTTDGAFLSSQIERALKLAHRNPNDPPRIKALEYALRELKV